MYIFQKWRHFIAKSDEVVSHIDYPSGITAGNIVYSTSQGYNLLAFKIRALLN